MTFCVHSFMYIAKESKGGEQYLFPRDNDMQFIPEFTVVDMRIMTGSTESSDGYGLKLQKISLHHTSLYSYMGSDSLLLLPDTLANSSELAVQRASENPFIQLQLEGKNVAFYAKAPAGAFISASPVAEGYYRMVGPNGSELFPGVPSVDIALADLLKHSNVVRKDGDDEEELVVRAITMYDFASCADSLGVYVVCARFFKTGDPSLGDFRCVPLVDVESFLKSVDFEGNGTEDAVITEDRIVFPFKHDIVDLPRPIVTVWTNPVTAALLLLESSSPPDLSPPPCPDFSLLSEECAVTRGYLVTIGTKEDPEILRFVFNVMGCQCSVGSVQRVQYSGQKRKESAMLMALKKRRGGWEEEPLTPT